MSYELQEDNLKEVEEHDAKCPSCGASIKFDPSSGKLTCPYCGYEEEIETPESFEEQYAQEIDFETAEAQQSFEWGSEKKVVICDACAAEMIYDALEVANVCPYCGSNHVMEAAAKNSLEPNGIVPFSVNKEQANSNFRRWIKSRWFAPNQAKKSAKADAFSGVYLPYWTFDTNTKTNYSARYGIDRRVTDKDGKTHTVTDWYSTRGTYKMFIDDYLVRASKRYNDSILKKVEPFETNKSLTFNQDYLHGYIAERYSVGLRDGWDHAKSEIQSMLYSQITTHIKRRHNAQRVSNLNIHTVHSNVKFKYLMLPLWLSSFKYKDKIYQFMVNGQTGKVGGQSPISPIKVAIAVVLGLIAAGIVLYLYQQSEGNI
ncbi:hypothetical protein CD30_04760 [Ureibacillus massiliensis 4400831 = CIP 108448 = CCUG 49529]|uniref:TFIIB-type domain-containing protein n=1 Tax=Ureibacillus massiliensis 4400831 = CIP 108448 = CCUG 49529 TaxID=1211035 RepID=A0A0A3J3U7_9BACL|nr:hypothetical protein [Ureibacillus massiliensis]KGR91621.1 hypothetical protein CD30_04760 [Ureibacillus massiliensis 4400831 = CIP 108448 = CCUG 49529]